MTKKLSVIFVPQTAKELHTAMKNGKLPAAYFFPLLSTLMELEHLRAEDLHTTYFDLKNFEADAWRIVAEAKKLADFHNATFCANTGDLQVIISDLGVSFTELGLYSPTDKANYLMYLNDAYGAARRKLAEDAPAISPEARA